MAAIALYVTRRQLDYKPVPGGYIAALLSAAVAYTLLTYTLELSSVGVPQKILWNQIQYVGAIPLPALLFFFTLRYTGYDSYLDWRTASLVLVPSVTVVGLAFTNDAHELVWRGHEVIADGGFSALVHVHGPAFVAYGIYTYLLVGVSLVLLVRSAVSSAGIYRRQALMLFAGAAVPALASVFYFSGINPYPKVNVPVVTFVFTAVAISWSVARHGLFTLAPIARKTAVEQMDDAVVVVDMRGLVVDVNPQAEQFLQVPLPEAVGKSIERALKPHAIPPGPDLSSDESESEVVTDPDSGRYYRRIASPLTDSDGVLLGQLLVLRDITERKRREERLRQQNEQLEEFASVVSHDLRNPLNVISGRLELARETGNEEHFEAVEAATDRMDRLIDDLLQLARQGQTVGETDPVDLRGVVEDAWRTVEAPEATLHIDGDVVLEADRDRLQQALENLFRNALDHVGPTVAIRVATLSDGFVVEDDGPGIPPDERDRIFEYGHTTDDDGTGFGLAIVREIVDAHGWDVTVTDGQEGGARFEMTGATVDRSVDLQAEQSAFQFD